MALIWNPFKSRKRQDPLIDITALRQTRVQENRGLSFRAVSVRIRTIPAHICDDCARLFPMRARVWTLLSAFVPALLLAAGGFYCWIILRD